MSSQHPYLTPTGGAHIRRDPRSQSRRSMTPNGRVPSHSSRLMASIEGDLGTEEDPRLAVFRDLTAKSEARLAKLLSGEDRAEAKEGQTLDDVGLVPQQEPKDNAPLNRHQISRGKLGLSTRMIMTMTSPTAMTRTSPPMCHRSKLEAPCRPPLWPLHPPP